MVRYVARYISLIVIVLVIWSVSFIPFKILSYGYLPPDDAMRHAAKAVSEKPWNQIVVLRNDIKIDSHTGWHTILAAIHKMAGLETFGLVLFSVVSLFLLFSLTAILGLRRPEAWILTLLTIAVADSGLVFRLLLGRPYIITMSAILLIGLMWAKLRAAKNDLAVSVMLTLAVATSTWTHGGWYLFALPIGCFFLAREWRAAFRITAIVLTGIIIGATATGAPVLFLKETLRHVFLAFGGNTPSRILVTEFQPSFGSFGILIVISLILIWHALRKSWNRKIIDNPVFIVVSLAWALSFLTSRIWLDIGLPALLAFMALEFQDFLESCMDALSWKRIIFTLTASLVLFLAITNDAGGRWSLSHPNGYLSMNNPEHRPWLPDEGGIVYSDDMGIFYGTFYKNPYALWRYILAFEPAIMPKEDLAIYRNIQIQGGTPESYAPWVRKMRREDRLIVRGLPKETPDIKDLEWHYVMPWTWSGRLPKEPAGK